MGGETTFAGWLREHGLETSAPLRSAHEIDAVDLLRRLTDDGSVAVLGMRSATHVIAAITCRGDLAYRSTHERIDTAVDVRRRRSMTRG